MQSGRLRQPAESTWYCHAHRVPESRFRNGQLCVGRPACQGSRSWRFAKSALRMICITQRECVQCGSGWDARRILRPIARAIGKKCNAADRPRPRWHKP
jgi:hypothetical protein